MISDYYSVFSGYYFFVHLFCLWVPMGCENIALCILRAFAEYYDSVSFFLRSPAFASCSLELVDNKDRHMHPKGSVLYHLINQLLKQGYKIFQAKNDQILGSVKLV